MGNADLAANRRDIDDTTVAAAAHVGQHMLHARRATSLPKVDSHCFLVVVQLHRFDRANVDDAGVIDQHIDRADLAANSRKQFGDFIWLEINRKYMLQQRKLVDVIRWPRPRVPRPSRAHSTRAAPFVGEVASPIINLVHAIHP